MIFVPTILLAYCTAVCWQPDALIPDLQYQTGVVSCYKLWTRSFSLIWICWISTVEIHKDWGHLMWKPTLCPVLRISTLYNGSLARNIATFCCNPDQRSSNIPNWWLGFVSSKVWVWESNFISFNNKKGLVSLVEPQLNLLLLQVFTALKFSFLRTLQREDRVTGFSRFQELRPALQS